MSGYVTTLPAAYQKQAVAILSVDAANNQATGLTRRESHVLIDLSYHVGAVQVTPSAGEQWYVRMQSGPVPITAGAGPAIGAHWVLDSKIPFNTPEITLPATEGQQQIGSGMGPIQLHGTQVNANGPLRLANANSSLADSIRRAREGLVGDNSALPDASTVDDGSLAYNGIAPVYSLNGQWVQLGTGNFTIPPGGIPNTDLTTEIQDALTLANSAFQLPTGGITLSTLTSGVQSSLGLANTSLQNIAGSVGLSNLNITGTATDGSSLLVEAGQLVFGVPGTDTGLQAVLDGLTGLTGATPTDLITEFGTIFSSLSGLGSGSIATMVANIANRLQYLNPNGLINSQALDNIANSILKNINNLGQFDASQLFNISNIPAIAQSTITGLETALGELVSIVNWNDLLMGLFGTTDPASLVTPYLLELASIPEIPISLITDLADQLGNLLGITDWNSFLSQANLALGTAGSDVAHFVLGLANIQLTNLAGFFAAFGASFPKIFPFNFAISTADVLAELVPFTQFQQLLDGLANNGILGNTVGTVIAAVQSQLAAAESNISQAIIDGINALNLSTGIAAVLQSIPYANITAVLGSINLGADLQALVTQATTALGGVGSTIAGLVYQLENIPFGNLLPVLGNANLGADLQALVTQATTALGGSTSTIAGFLTQLETLPLGNISGLLASIGSSFPKVFPFNFAISTANTLASLVGFSQFQELIDGLAGNGIIGNTIGMAVASVQSQLAAAESNISQAIVDGLNALNLNTGIAQALQAIPYANLTAVLGGANLGADLQNLVTRATSALGGVTTTLGGLINQLTAIPYANITSLFANANLGADLQALITQATSALGGSTTTISGLITQLQNIPLPNLTGLLSAIGSSFPKTFPFNFGVSTSNVIGSLVNFSQFQQLLDGLANNGILGNTVATVISSVQSQIAVAEANISQAILDGINFVNANTGIAQVLQAFPYVNITAALGGINLGADLQNLVSQAVSALGGVGGTIAGFVSSLQHIPFANLLPVLGNANLGADLQALVTQATSALGGATTSLSGLVAQLGAIPYANLLPVLGSANLGADLQAVVTQATSALGGATSTITGLVTALQTIPLPNLTGLLSVIGSSFPKTFPFNFGTSTTNTIGSLVNVAQFQQLLDGLAGTTGNTVGSAVASVQSQIATAEANISQAILDGVNAANLNTGIAAVLQAIPNANIGAVLGGLNLGADVQAIVTQATLALGGATSTIAGLFHSLQTIPFANLLPVLGSANLGADIQAVVTQATSALGGATTTIAGLATALQTIPLPNLTGLLSVIGSSFPKTFPFNFGTSTTNTLGGLVNVQQFQQLLDGLSGQTGSTVASASAAVQQQLNQASAGISQAIQDGLNGVLGGGAAITQALQAIPFLNVTSALTTYVSPIFDAVGVGNAASGTSPITWSHMLASNATAIMVAVGVFGDAAGSVVPTITATVGGVPMTLLGNVPAYWIPNAITGVRLFGLLNPPTGAQTVSVSPNSSALQLVANSCSYTNVTAFGQVVTNTGSTAIATLSVPAASNEMVFQTFSGGFQTFSAYNQNQRYNVPWVGGLNIAFMIGDAPGASTVNFTATQPVQQQWGAIGVPLIGVPVTVPGSSLGSDLQSLVTQATTILGGATTTLSGFINQLTAIPYANITSLFANANLGADLQALITQATSALGGATTSIAGLATALETIPLPNLTGLLAVIGSSFPKTFPFNFGTSTTNSIGALVNVAQFQQLLDGLAGSAGNTVGSAVSSIQAQFDAAASTVTQAIQDGLAGLGGGGITQALQAIPFANVTSPFTPSVTTTPIPPVFDAVGAGAATSSGAVTTLSWSHVLASNATAIVVAVDTFFAPSTLSVTVGGVAATLLGSISFTDSGVSSAVWLFGLLYPPTGVRTVAVTSNVVEYMAGNSLSYTNATGFGPVATNTAGAGPAPTLSVTAGPGQVVAQAFGGSSIAFTAYNQTQRYNVPFVSNSNVPFVLGDAPGMSTVTFNCANTFQQWGGIGVPVIGTNVTSLGADLQNIVTLATTALGGAGSTITGFVNQLLAIPYANITSVLGVGASLGADLQAVVTQATSALGGATTTLAGLVTKLGAIPYANLLPVLGSANLGADVQAVVTQATSALGGSTSTIAGLVTALENVPLGNLTGLLAQIGSSFPKTFPFTFGTSTANTLANLVSQSQFQQLLDGLSGTVGNTVASAAAAVQQQLDQSSAVISQAIQDGLSGIPGASAITQALQGIPFTNITSVFNPPYISPVFDAVGAGTTLGAFLTTSWSHTLGVNATAIVVAVDTYPNPETTLTATVGGVPMTPLGSVLYYTPSGAPTAYLYLFGLLSPPKGSQTVIVTSGINEFIAANSLSYTGVSGFGPVATNFGSSVFPFQPTSTLSVPSGPQQMVAMAFGGGAATLTSFNQTQRYNVPFNVGGNDNLAFLMGDAPGAASVTFTCSHSGDVFGGIGVPLIGMPLPPTTPGLGDLGADLQAVVAAATSALNGAGATIGGFASALQNIPFANLLPVLNSANLGADVQAIVTQATSALGGATTTIAGLAATLGAIPYANLLPVLGSANLGADLQAVVTQATSALGGATTTIAGLATKLGAIPFANLLPVLTGANLGADVQSIVTQATSALGGSTSTLAGLVTALETIPLGNLTGLLSVIGASFPKTFPFTFGTSTTGNLGALVNVAQFQQLLDGLAGTANNTVASAVAAVQKSAAAVHGDISQAIQDGLNGVLGAGSAITQALQAIPHDNITSVFSPPVTTYTTPTFDAVGPGAITSGNYFGSSWTHVVGHNATALVVAIQQGPNPQAFTTVTVGGIPMTLLGVTPSYYPTVNLNVYLFGLLNPPLGSQTVTVTLGTNAEFWAANSLSYNGVAAFGDVVTNTGFSNIPFLNVPAAAGQMVVQAFGGDVTTFASYNQTQRYNTAALGQNYDLLIGDAPGSSTVSFTCSEALDLWGAIGVPLIGVSTTTPGSSSLGADIQGAVDTLAQSWGAQTAGNTLTNLEQFSTNIPNTVVQGILNAQNLGQSLQNTVDYGVQSLASTPGLINNTLSSFSNYFSGLTTLLGFAPSSGTPPTGSISATQQTISSNIAAKATQKPTWVSWDNTADGPFPLTTIMNTTNGAGTAVAVTQGSAAVCFDRITDAASKQSVGWMGYGTLTGFTGFYVTVYQVDTTLGNWTQIWQSANILGSVSASASVPVWNFYSPAAMNYINAAQGNLYAVAISVTGSGTYNISGQTNNITDLPNTYIPEAPGATLGYPTVAYDATGSGFDINSSTAPSALAYDSTGAGASTPTGTSISWSHTIGAAATAVVISLFSSAGAPTVTVGGVGAAQLFVSGGAYIYGLLSPPTGSVTVAVSGPSGDYVGNSVAYSGVINFGNVVLTSGSGTSITQSVSGTSGELVVQTMFAVPATSGSITSYNRTQRVNMPATATSVSLLIGDFTGASGSVTGSATAPAGTSAWSSFMMPLIGGTPGWDSVGASGVGASGSYSHTVGPNATAILAVAASTTAPTSVTFGGVSATKLITSTNGTDILTVWGLINPPTGAVSIVWSGAGAGTMINSVAYIGVSGFGTAASASSLSESISGTANNLVFQGISTSAGTFSAYNQTQRYTAGNGTFGILAGDFVGASGSTTGTGTATGSSPSSAMIPLIGQIAVQVVPTVDATGTSSSTGTPAAWTHTIAANATALCVQFETATAATPVVEVNGVPLTQLTSSNYVGSHTHYMYGLLNPPKGAVTITVSMGSGLITGSSVSFKGVASFGTIVAATGSSTAPTQTISTPTVRELVFQSIAGFSQGTTTIAFSGYTGGTQETNQASIGGSLNAPLVTGVITGTGVSITGSATLSYSTNWSSLMVQLTGFYTPTTGQCTHTATAGSTVILTTQAALSTSTALGLAFTATYGGQAMTMLSTAVANMNTGNQGFMAQFVLYNAPGGAQSVSVSAQGLAATGWVQSLTFNSVSYTNAQVALPVSGTVANGSFGALSVNVTNATSGMICLGWGQWASSGAITLSAFNRTQRSLHNVTSNGDNALLIGDATTSGSVSFTGTSSVTTADAVLATVLSPVPSVLYDATGTGYSTSVVGSNVGATWTHNATAGATVVAFVAATGGTLGHVSAFTWTATYGGQAMTLLSSVDVNNTTNAGFLACFYIQNVTGGSQTISIATSGVGGQVMQAVVGNSTSYTGVNPVNGVVLGTTGNGVSGGTVSATTNGSSGEFQVWGTTMVSSGGTLANGVLNTSWVRFFRNMQTELTATWGTTLGIVDWGTQPGASSITFNWTSTTGGAYADIPVRLTPVPTNPTTILNPNTAANSAVIYAAATPWIGLGGAGGVTQHAPVLLPFTSSSSSFNPGTQYSWANYIDVIVFGAGGGGDGGTSSQFGLGGSCGASNAVTVTPSQFTSGPWTITIGAPGAGAAINGGAGGAGSGSSVVIPGHSTVSAGGGAGGNGIAGTITGQSEPSVTWDTFYGVANTYTGGAGGFSTGNSGAQPGGAGAGGGGYQGPGGGAGGNGEVWLLVYQ